MKMDTPELDTNIPFATLIFSPEISRRGKPRKGRSDRECTFKKEFILTCKSLLLIGNNYCKQEDSLVDSMTHAIGYHLSDK